MPVEAPLISLTEFRKLPPVDAEMQFDDLEFEVFMKEKMKKSGYKGQKGKTSSRDSSIAVQKAKVSMGQQCSILDED